MSNRNKRLNVAIICGGPSLERGISLNSARSACDHLHSDQINIIPFYLDHKKNAFQISRAQLYSNTPSDFDFKLKRLAKPLSKTGFVKALKRADVTFPIMHGAYGEDGQLQNFLEKNGIHYVGSPAASCRQAFDKFDANEFIRENGFTALPSIVLEKEASTHLKQLKDFFSKHKLKQVIVKPARGGSSIAVYLAANPKDALGRAKEIFSGGVDSRVVVEPFCQGQEFTVIILENRFGLPVALLPAEIDIGTAEYEIFDYRKKYLPSKQVHYHCPPRFSNEIVERIQIQAEQLFSLFKMRDFARFDGWLLKDGSLWFSDFNPISGMEQNSFLFIQSTRVGMSHRSVLRYVLDSACRRYKIPFPEEEEEQSIQKKPVQVIFGGKTAERQVSVMSGTNVWLKLRRSKKYQPVPYFLDYKHRVWPLPYAFALNHTAEEVLYMCEAGIKAEERLGLLKTRVIDRLAADSSFLRDVWLTPKPMKLQDFISQANCVFIGLHGGIGEDGTIQEMLEKERVPFNGPGSEASRLCMDKYKTGKRLETLKDQGIFSAKRVKISLTALRKKNTRELKQYWDELKNKLCSESLIVKPLGDGCSAGVARLYTEKDLKAYVKHAAELASCIPEGTLTKQHGLIELPSVQMKTLIFEEFIQTDYAKVVKNKLHWQTQTGWIEITCGVLEDHNGLRSLSPSVTVASGNILSLEEKFQGGTGVNITPPPRDFVRPSAIQKAKKRVELVALTLGLAGYSRIDAFMHVESGELIVIEANTLPGLTAATVIYHQALAEKPAIYPVTLLEKLVDHSLTRYQKKPSKRLKIKPDPQKRRRV